ncbi:MAG: hypothetical protein F6J95_031165 [Leptolyngbya sp. SIO1E4]|nr:hypothetical protein [Leptolyngbya sp. SIO1E4]
MDRAKALAGEKAGEWVKATQPRLTYEVCKAWKLYCPTCYQPVHLRKSKKIKSYFAHYDFENKSCPERAPDSYKSGAAFSLESRDQDLEEIETFIEQIFYGINPSYFQSLKPEELTENFDLLSRNSAWFSAHTESVVRKWVQHFCREHGFLDWKNPHKEANYIVDCLHILSERKSIFKEIILYSISILRKESESKLNDLELKFGLPETSISEEILISSKMVDLVIHRLSKLMSEEGELDIVVIPSIRDYIDVKIPENKKAIRFKRQGLSSLIRSIDFSNFPILVGTRKAQGISYYICFKKDLENQFCFYSVKDETHFVQEQNIEKRNDKPKPSSGIMSVHRKNSKAIATIYRQEDKRKKQKNKDKRIFKNLHEDCLELYVDDLSELFVRGFIERKLEKVLIKGIQKIFFNKTECSILSLLSKGFISNDVAEKAAQLALKTEYPDLDEPQALQKFRELFY